MLKKLFVLVAVALSLAACHPDVQKPVDCSTLSTVNAQAQCYGKISPQP